MQAGEGLQGAADQAAQKAPEVGGKMEDGIRSGAQQTKDKAPQAGGAAGEVRLYTIVQWQHTGLLSLIFAGLAAPALARPGRKWWLCSWSRVQGGPLNRPSRRFYTTRYLRDPAETRPADQ